MKKTYFISAIFILCSYSELFSQGWEKVYQNIYSHDISSGSANIQKTQVTSDGGIILIAYGPDSANVNHYKNYIIKTDSLGNIEWSRFIADTAAMMAECVVEINGGYLVGGSCYGPRFGFLLKIDGYGNLLWSKSYNGSQMINMIQKSAKGYVLLGELNVGSGGVFLAEIDTLGSVYWTKTLNIPWLCNEGIAPTENNGFIVIVKKGSNTYGMGCETDVIRFDSLGNTMWAKSYTYANNFDIRSIKQIANGNYILAGSVLMEIDKNGNLQWVKRWFSTLIHDFEQTSDGGYIAVAGDYWNIGGIFLFKISSAGIPQWEQEFGGSLDRACNIHITSGGNFLLSGEHVDNVNNKNGFYLIKANSMGQSGCNTKNQTLTPYQVYPSLCVINNLILSMGSNSVVANFTESTQPIVIQQINPCCYAKPEISNDDYFTCSGDSIHLSGSGGLHLLWYTGDTSRTMVTKDTIIILQINNTCGNFSDTLIIHPAFVPSFTYSVTRNSICRGDSVSLTISGNAPYYSCVGGGYA